MATLDQNDDAIKAERARQSKLTRAALMRLAEARRQKTQFELDFREGYWFAAPHRRRSVYSNVKPTQWKPKDAAELNTSFAFEICGDFPTVILNTFCPEQANWVTRRLPPGVAQGLQDDVKEKIQRATQAQDKDVFLSIGASNFYAESGKAFNPDLALGTVAMWIDHPVTWKSPRCQAIPLRELEINVGPDGSIDDRFVVRWTKLRYLDAILPKTPLPEKIRKARDKDDSKDCQVIWGFWRIYDDTQDEKWQHVVLIDETMVASSELTGEGCCPLIVARFNPCPEWAFGMGPLIQALPDLRMMDELDGDRIDNINLMLRPPIGFPDDSFANISEGLEAGFAYPVRPGSEGAIKNIYEPPAPAAAIYFTQDKEMRIKRLFFLDWPDQLGKTPPTATQWLDQMTLAQRRIGTPGMPFWKEWCAGAFQRFVYLLEKAGKIEKIRVNGKIVPLMPYNPAQRSAEQEEVAMFARFGEIGGQMFPEEFKMKVDGSKTLEKLASKMSVNDVVVWRDEGAVAGAIGNIAKLIGGATPGAPAMPQGQPMPQDTAGAPTAAPKFEVRSNGPF